jgi:hypothetical protein
MFFKGDDTSFTVQYQHAGVLSCPVNVLQIACSLLACEAVEVQNLWDELGRRERGGFDIGKLPKLVLPCFPNRT